MIFLKPEYLVMMLIPTLVLFYLIISNKSALELYFDEKILQKLRFDNNALGRVGRNMMLFVALIMMIIALARPVIEKGEIAIQTKSIDILVALDISKSMLASDIYPTRLAFAKKRFMELVDYFTEANIAVIAFSSEGFLVSPMTQDSTTLKYLVDHLSLESMSVKGTNLWVPIEKGRTLLKEAKEKIIILFTDGGDGKSFSKEIKRAKAYGEHIYIYAVGTSKGAAIKEKGESIKDEKGNIVITRLNEKIKTLAFETQGAYIVGDHDDESIKLLVADIKHKFKMHKAKAKKMKRYRELFYYPLTLAILFMLFAFSSLPQRKSLIMIALIMIATPKGAQARVFDFFEIDKARETYNKGAYEKAKAHYEELVRSNKSAQSIYNFANAQYKTGHYKEALKSYQRVIATTKTLKYKKAFNSGNAYMQLNEYEKAIEAYERAKESRDDADVEYNLALAKKRLKKKQKKTKKNNKKKEDSQKNGKKRDQKGSHASNKNEKNKQKQTQEEKSPQKQAQKEEVISKKEEKMWERQLERTRAKTIPMKLKMPAKKRSDDEKPW